MTEETKKRSFRLWMLKWVVAAGGLVVFSLVVAAGAKVVWEYGCEQYAYATEAIVRKLTRVEVQREIVSPSQMPIEELIDQISREIGIPPVVTRAMANQESGVGYHKLDRVRYEEHLLHGWVDKNGKRHPPIVNPPPGLNEIERQLYSSSFGIIQVIYGIHYKRCGWSSFNQAFDPASNLRCGLSYLKAQWEEAAKLYHQPGDIWREALRRYNGAGPDAEAYADQVMQRVADQFLSTIGKSI